ncbi:MULTISPECIES: urea amidolyase associated protein UAAP1 [Corynebacterium]|uniref:urea amidolyase associated protein UAAP1 n=1 Tax=Corynebacterium TaxID=1716 RepID=UPI00257A101A|nr:MULTISPECIES: urea amidolyase associated protein UAAP1 [Corynebacterium]
MATSSTKVQDHAKERENHATATVSSARDDARAQGVKTSEFQPYVPASSSPFVPEDVDPGRLVWAESVSPGGYTHKVLARGTRIRFEDVTGEACAHVLLFNALEPWERFNAADTVKIPWQAYLTEGHPLLSGDGRVLATIAADTSEHHDSLCGFMSDAQTQEKYGNSVIYSVFPSGQTLFEQAAVKHGLNARDIAPSASFFKGVHVEEDGRLEFTGSAGAGKTVDLIVEMPLIILIANSPHPLDPRPDYVNGPLRIHAWRSEATEVDSPVAQVSPERHRAYLNTISYIQERGL